VIKNEKSGISKVARKTPGIPELNNGLVLGRLKVDQDGCAFFAPFSSNMECVINTRLDSFLQRISKRSRWPKQEAGTFGILGGVGMLICEGILRKHKPHQHL
jgi:hypothetical protein